jgi:hypothetical protein
MTIILLLLLLRVLGTLALMDGGDLGLPRWAAVGSRQLAVSSWQSAVGSQQLAVSSWQS